MTHRIALDFGHGIETIGKSYANFHEWKFNRLVGGYLCEYLDLSGIKYDVLVPEDIDIPLRTRVERANKPYLLLISIHSNAFTDDLSVSGVETWYYSKEGKIAANIFQNNLVGYTGMKDRGIKKCNFYIVKKSRPVAILTESGFYTNTEERERLLTEKFQRRIAFAHFKSIEEYLI